MQSLVACLPPAPAAGSETPAIRAGLSYLCPTDARPCAYAYPPPPGTPWESGEYESPAVPIADARRAPMPPTLDQEGFELHAAPTSVRDFLDDEMVRRRYYPEAVDLALAVTGARRGYVFDHLVRRREAQRPGLSFGRGLQDGRPGANGRIHNDYTEASGRRRLELVIADARERAGVGRFAIINLWRSIKAPVLDTPLALCDARSIDARDLVVAEVRYPRRSGEIYLVTRSPRHRWCYFPAMDRHEALVFKQYDSQVSGVARFTPHAAFDYPDTPPDAPLRESIELRCLVVYE
ncbi:CmcJ/NvfI family oxidoreductase [Azohydromonas caseinilytica]|uniref:Methyltransferase n=1 Tax=Azohydromonas caseinilytica TaxID=2728836 RepID=A0A848FGG8_9BURK|nr:CmcJ/NvfI family oxidoreductase [Azohydromonas caseinilytica]NML17250.1 methyltransferase [Azohydromonas caseinilytica]